MTQMFPSNPQLSDNEINEVMEDAAPNPPTTGKELATQPSSKINDAPVTFNNGELQTTTIEGAQRIALGYCMSGWYPQITSGARSNQERIARMMIVIATGRQLGLTDHAAASYITPINGRLSIWGDAMVAIVRRSPTCHSIDAKFDKANKSWTVTGRRFRADGSLDEVTHTFGMEDAIAAGYDKKGGSWKTVPLRMCLNRARMYVIRDLWADLLCGICDTDEEIDNADAERTERQNVTADGLRGLAE